MRVVNTVELKNRTNEVLRDVVAGEPVIVTLRGKPAAAITKLTEAGLAEFVLAQTGEGRVRGGSIPQAQAVRFTSVPAALGDVYVAYTDRGVAYVDLAPGDTSFIRTVRARLGVDASRDPLPPSDLLDGLRTFLADFAWYPGPVDLSRLGSFQRRVLEQLRRIPRGQVRTYRAIAKEIGHPGATRAVGTACARNPVPLVIPCHRVVRSDGGLGGYSLRGGVALKRRLLEQEGVDVSMLRI
jgi:methylated-DNA-[protein]-cysteine S-methyltransferase